MGNGITECGWHHAPEARGGFWEILKKLVELRLDTERDGWLSLARGGLGQVSYEMGGGGRWKSKNGKNVYLPPYVEEPLNSKVIISFVPELRNRYVFFEFRDLMFYVMCVIYIYEHHMYISYIYVYGYGTNVYMISTGMCVRKKGSSIKNRKMVGWSFGFHGISTFVSYLMLNSFLNK